MAHVFHLGEAAVDAMRLSAYNTHADWASEHMKRLYARGEQ